MRDVFDAPCPGIRPIDRIALLRYAKFHWVADDQTIEVAFFCDFLHLMRQAGQLPLPPQTGAYLVQPGPAKRGSLCYGPYKGARTPGQT